MKFPDVEAREACRLIGFYTNYNYDVWMLAGPAQASNRARVMTILMGRKMPQSKSGVRRDRPGMRCAMLP